MYNTDEYIELIKGRLSPYRFNHSMCVADRAVELAKSNNLDSQKAYVAGILHDIMKEESLDSQQKIIESTGYTMTAVELASPNVYHQMSGAVYVRDILGIDVKLKVAAKTLRTINKYGSLDNFLLGFGFNKLSEKGRKLRTQLLKKQKELAKK